MDEQLSQPFDLLLGKKTYDIFASYWPHQTNENSVTEPFNKARKYVVTHSEFDPTWENTIVITGDVVEKIKALKAEDGPDLQVHGSSDFIQTLLKNDLVDELWLKIFPITLGSGKKLFAEGTIPVAFELIDSKTTPRGVVIANYRRAGDVKTGSFA